jgi:hypothetical protein
LSIDFPGHCWSIWNNYTPVAQCSAPAGWQRRGKAQRTEGTCIAAGQEATASLNLEVWNERANRFVDACLDEMWFGQSRGREYMVQERRIQPDILMINFIGYHPVERYEAGKLWGFSQRDKVWLPQGIVFPVFDRQMGAASIKIRRLDGKPKYVKVAGSKSGVFGFRNLCLNGLVGVTEGEIDCLTLEQEAGKLLGACTLGSAADHFGSLDLLRWGAPLITAQAILLFYDNDQAGKTGSQRMDVSQVSYVVGTLQGYKDLNEVLVKGVDVGEWVCRKVEGLGLG